MQEVTQLRPDARETAGLGGRAPWEHLQAQVRRYCPPWLRDQADDIAQTAWLRLRDAEGRSERNRVPGASLISRVAYCATIDEIRRRRRRREVPIEEVTIASETATPDPERSAGAREIGGAIRQCLAGLLPDRRVAVTLYLQGHTGPETGAILGWNLKRAENMIFRGLADLRRCLGAKGLAP